jgi:hypothetical protein
MITQALLHQILSYDKDTGEFTWLNKPSASIKANSTAGRLSNKGYKQITYKGKQYSSHRLAWLYVYGEWPTGSIDHINGVRTDNSIANLRDVSLQINMQNLVRPRKNNKSGYLGVCWDGYMKCYKSAIKIDGKSIHLGYYDNPRIAHDAYVTAKRTMHEGCTI